LGGRVAGQFYEGDRRTGIVVRLPEHIRTDIDGLAKLPIQRPHVLAAKWLWTYNNERGHTVIADIAPRQLLNAA